MKIPEMMSIDWRVPLADPAAVERLAARQQQARIRMGARALAPWDPRPSVRYQTVAQDAMKALDSIEEAVNVVRLMRKDAATPQ